MRIVGIEALYPKPNLSRPVVGHEIYPYLLRGVSIERPNQVWSTDITYIPLRGGFLYLVAVMDWFSRFVLSWELSNTMEIGFCVAALDARSASASPRSGTPIRVPNSPRPIFSRRSNGAASPSAWMDAAARWTTFSSSACGAA
jgi:putative transposase